MDTPAAAADELLDALPLPYFAVRTIDENGSSPDACVTWANHAARVRFGEVVGRWIRRDAPLGLVDDLVQHVASGVRDATIERTLVDSGHAVNERVRVVALASGAALLVENIDEEVRARDELTVSTDALARTQHWGNVGVWDLDIESGQLYWSTQIYALLGVDQAGLDEFRSAVHPEDIPLIDHLQERVLAQPGPYRATHRIVRGDEIRTVDQHVQSVADDDGNPVRIIGTVVDVTEMHQLREQVLQAERARTIGVVAAGVAHDFNNLLTVVEGHASLLLGQTDDVDMRAGLEAIKRAASQASTTTRKLMGLGRQESITCAPVEMRGLFADVAGWTRPAMPHVTVEEIADGGTAALADEDVLRQVLLDLVLNACDAQATTVRLVAQEVDLDSRADPVGSGEVGAGAHVRVDVVDDGTGMDESTRARALEPFFSTKARQDGSGLGLATAVTNVAQMNGHLEIDTEPGRGTTISIYLPSADQGEHELRSTARSTATRMVVACADAKRAERARRIVADAGHQVVVVSDVRALRFCLASEPIDAAVVDVGLSPPGRWPDALTRCPTVWVDDLETDGAEDEFRALVAGLSLHR